MAAFLEHRYPVAEGDLTEAEIDVVMGLRTQLRDVGRVAVLALRPDPNGLARVSYAGQTVLGFLVTASDYMFRSWSGGVNHILPMDFGVHCFSNTPDAVEGIALAGPRGLEISERGAVANLRLSYRVEPRDRPPFVDALTVSAALTGDPAERTGYFARISIAEAPDQQQTLLVSVGFVGVGGEVTGVASPLPHLNRIGTALNLLDLPTHT